MKEEGERRKWSEWIRVILAYSWMNQASHKYALLVGTSCSFQLFNLITALTQHWQLLWAVETMTIFTFTCRMKTTKNKIKIKRFNIFTSVNYQIVYHYHNHHHHHYHYLRLKIMFKFNQVKPCHTLIIHSFNHVIVVFVSPPTLISTIIRTFTLV